MATGISSLPHSSQIRSMRGSSIGTSFPLLSRMPRSQSDFEAPSATLHGIIELRDHFLGEIGIVNLAPIHLCENNETAGIGLDNFIQNDLQLFAPHTREDN